MSDHETIERRREWNEGAHYPSGPLYWSPENGDRGNYAVRLVRQSECVERIVSHWHDLRWALEAADILRSEESRPWRNAGKNPRAHMLVDVIDLDDPERGGLDWDDVA